LRKSDGGDELKSVIVQREKGRTESKNVREGTLQRGRDGNAKTVRKGTKYVRRVKKKVNQNTRRVGKDTIPGE